MAPFRNLSSIFCDSRFQCLDLIILSHFNILLNLLFALYCSTCLPYQVNICKTDPNRRQVSHVFDLKILNCTDHKRILSITDYTNLIPGFCNANGFLVSSVHLCNTQRACLRTYVRSLPILIYIFENVNQKRVHAWEICSRSAACCLSNSKNARVGSHLTSDVILSE